MSTQKRKPLNQKLYDEVKKEIYAEQPKHSLFRSARIQQEYKRRGGTYDNNPLPDMNIKKWFKQNWISINDYVNGDIVPCGKSNIKDQYPLCRPLAIAQQLTIPQMKQMIQKKQAIKNKPLKTASIIGTDALNIKATKTGTRK